MSAQKSARMHCSVNYFTVAGNYLCASIHKAEKNGLEIGMSQVLFDEALDTRSG